MHKQTAVCVAAVISGVLILSAIARAQAATATLGGSVVDESAAVVPDVRLTVVNIATGLQRSAVAGSQGTFVVSLLPPGRYRLTARRDGFVTTEIPDIVLNVGDMADGPSGHWAKLSTEDCPLSGARCSRSPLRLRSSRDPWAQLLARNGSQREPGARRQRERSVGQGGAHGVA